MPHHDHRYFEKRAARAREVAGHKGGGRDARVAGHLALAYSALARRKKAQDELSES